MCRQRVKNGRSGRNPNVNEGASKRTPSITVGFPPSKRTPSITVGFLPFTLLTDPIFGNLDEETKRANCL